MRMYPANPKQGVQATKPNEKWHIDISVLRLLDGTKVYLHSVIDNFSRKILGWQVLESMRTTTTCEILQDATRHLHRDEPVQLVCDGGLENFNADVDAVIEQFDWERIGAGGRVTSLEASIVPRVGSCSYAAESWRAAP